MPDLCGYTMSAPGVRVTLDSGAVVEAYPVEGQEGPEIRWVKAQGPIGRISILTAPSDERPGAGAWRLAAELAGLLGEGDDAQDARERDARLRRGVLFAECLKVVYEWLAHENIAVTERDLRGDGMRTLAESAIADALVVEGRPARKLGIASDAARPLRSAGEWKPFLTGLVNIKALEHSELNVAACHSRLEVEIAHALDHSRLVAGLVRNHGPERIEIPYKYKGGWAKYVPDFFVRCRKRNGAVAHIVLEGKGPARRAQRAERVVDRPLVDPLRQRSRR